MSALLDAPASEVAPAAIPATPARIAASLAILVAVVGAALGPTGQLDVLLGPDAVSVAAGRVEARAADGWAVVPVGEPVPTATPLRTPDGMATLAVPGGAVDVAGGSRLTVADTLVVTAGTVVVRSPQVVVGDGVATATGPGAWRYDASGRFGAYTGSALLTDAAGREALVRPLQEVRVRESVVTGPARPYVYTGSDPFDRTYLAPALRVDDYLAALHRGLEADYGTAPQPFGFYTDFDGLDGQLVTALGDVSYERVDGRIGPPADVLVAAVVTEALVVGAGLPPQQAADEVRDLRLDGATWGLIVQGRELDAGDVRAAADRALTRRQLAEAQGTATPAVDTPAAPQPGPTSPSPGPSAPGSSPDAPDAPDAEEPGPTPSSPPPSEAPEEEAGPVGEAVEDLGGDDLVGGEVGELVDDVVDTADDVLDGPEADAPSEPDPTVDGSSDDGGLLDDTGELLGDTVDTLESGVDTLLGG